MWVRASMDCDICLRQWEAVYPLEAYDEIGEIRLECPGCGHHVLGPHRNELEVDRSNG